MSDDTDLTGIGRRTFVATVGAGALGTVGVVRGRSDRPSPVVLKGTERSPVSRRDIRAARDRYLRKLVASRDDPPEEVALSMPRNDREQFVAGYALGFEDGSPVEMVRTVTTSDALTGRDDRERTAPSDRAPSVGVQSAEPYDAGDSAADAHDEIDQFVRRLESGIPTTQSSPEPPWTRVGTVSESADARFRVGGNSYLGGKIDLYTAIYKVENDSRSSQTNFACKLRGTMWPSNKLDGGVDDVRNWSTYVSQNWDENQFGGLEIGEWGPKSDVTGSIDWSLSIGATSSGGVQGTVSASYDTPHIQRVNKSDYNETIAHRYNYPKDILGMNPGARWEIVGLESLGEAWLNSNDSNWSNVLETEMEGTFFGRVNSCSGLFCDTVEKYPSGNVVTLCYRNRLTDY